MCLREHFLYCDQPRAVSSVTVALLQLCRGQALLTQILDPRRSQNVTRTRRTTERHKRHQFDSERSLVLSRIERQRQRENSFAVMEVDASRIDVSDQDSDREK